MSDPSPGATRPGSAPATSELASRLGELCSVIAPEFALRAIAERVLSACVAATGATRASLLVINPETGRLTMLAATGLPDRLVGHDLAPRPRSIAEWVLTQRRGLVLNGEVHDQRFDGTASAEHLESALSLPIESESGAIGVLNLARHAPAPVFDETEMRGLGRALEPVGAAFERLRRLERGTRLVEQLAQSPAPANGGVPPHGVLEIRNFEIATRRRASAADGSDRCDRVTHARGQHTVLASDVTGAGTAALDAAAFTHGLFVALASAERSAVGLVARLSAELHQRLGDRRPVSLWLAQLAPNGDVASCNAGAPPPLWVPADGSAIVRLDRGGPPAGALAQPGYEEEHLRLLPGDLLVFASDGLLDARDGSDRRFGAERVEELVAAHHRDPLDRLAETLLDAARSHSGRPVPVDDHTVLALRYLPER